MIGACILFWDKQASENGMILSMFLEFIEDALGK